MLLDVLHFEVICEEQVIAAKIVAMNTLDEGGENLPQPRQVHLDRQSHPSTVSQYHWRKL